MKYFHRMLQLAVLVVLSGVLGCSAPPSLIGFNDKMARANKKLAGQGKAFRKALEPLGKGENVPAVNVQQAYEDVRKTLEDIKDSFRDQELPARHSGNAPAMLELYQKFLETQDVIVNKHMKAIVDICADRTSNPQDKWSKIQPQLSALSGVESKVVQDLGKAQEAFAKEHEYKVVTKR